jgi:hypothetical protein
VSSDRAKNIHKKIEQKSKSSMELKLLFYCK